ncbi:MAG: type II toxin-antitoxin system VapC family toxin [Chitinophagales bacterium]|nr:type II toxin-antitoxin system VapC family toxin [Chitinophagales bacterium]
MEQYLIDNNAISYFFSELLNDSAMQFMANVIDKIPNISVITQIEALSWTNKDKNKESILKEFINDSNILFITPNIVAECVRIRRSRKIKTPDAIIAATAIVNNFTLITADADFENIDNLKILNPNKI